MFFLRKKDNYGDLGCLEKKTNCYSLVVQYSWVEEGQRSGV